MNKRTIIGCERETYKFSNSFHGYFAGAFIRILHEIQYQLVRCWNIRADALANML